MARIEKDSLGELELPEDALYGVQTARALMNFPVSGMTPRPEFVKSYIYVKKACALANKELGALDNERGEAIAKACDEVLDGKHDEHFVVDVFQAGAGTSFNMNVNEVLAHRALQILKRPLDDHEFLGPNDHVNMSQSTNDTFPTASHVAIIISSPALILAVEELVSTLKIKSEQFKDIPKSGRTHLMDATPLRLGDEFGAYASSLNRGVNRIVQRREDLLEVALGGTAVGTGMNTPQGFRDLVIKYLNKISGFAFTPASNSFEQLASRSQMAAFSSALKELAIELTRLANDLRLMGSGPTTGFNEIVLPAVQPGSSIMPGKINPSLPECLNMVAFQVVGNDTAVTLAAQGGQLDLNVFTPLMIHNILQSMSILTNYLPVFTKKCIDGIQANETACKDYLQKNPSLATLLAPKIGYMAAAEIAKEAMEKGVAVKDLAVEKGIISKEEADDIFDEKKMSSSKY
jgi:aspartate ammonia-lyase